MPQILRPLAPPAILSAGIASARPCSRFQQRRGGDLYGICDRLNDHAIELCLDRMDRPEHLRRRPDQFLAFGVSGFAVGELYRRSVDSITLEPGCVDLSLFSRVQAQPVVEGHTPCTSHADCPEGQKCNIFINTCVDE